MRLQHRREIGAGHQRAYRRHLIHPEGGDRVGVLLGLTDGDGEPPDRRRHARERGVDAGRFLQVHPCDPQMVGVMEARVRHFAALERARQLRVGHT